MTPNDPDEWLDRSLEAIARAPLGPVVRRSGRVERVSDGVAMVSGLPEARAGERLVFEGGQSGFVHVLDEETLAAVLLDDIAGVAQGDAVTGTGDVMRVPVGPDLLGRIVDPLGRPLDGLGPITTTAKHPVERPAPAIIDRAAVVEPMQTGTLVVDALFALGRGQRELIVGDRATGKTTIALDTILNQKDGDVTSVYVAIGQKTSSVERVIETLRRNGALARTIVVVAGPSTPPGMQWLAPFAGMTMAEELRDTGGHALIVLDDLTRHAASHRELALLTRQTPGREAYPGDIFYLHARLLERAARLSDALGSGTLTALPIAETDAGNLAAFIPTNLISITDGQIALDAKLFNRGQKPAVDVGTSVSRVGGKTQARSLRDAAESMRLDYAQFLELEIFTRFGGMPDTRVKAQLARGRAVRAVLAQIQHAPLRLADEVALVLAVQTGLLDGLEPAQIDTLRAALPDALDAAGLSGADFSATLSEGLHDQIVECLKGLLPEPAK
ncbi:F0F1 ATP synthase subunit alpha [Thioclava sp. F28-4]|uniref:F0F1 ATP synthase subunit alpha n=1 Tax=Thioclava sp. F28-4 TaxID=1915315 RepID=UPI000996FBE0|nr:F0F1 ATP synthase subunit alpha [Thioclava sp. F28-4]OOY06673.1 F0F1 ATP synthase subunit alpha [Thioclava sp. F28-4]